MSETSPLRSPQRFSPAGESVRYPQCRGHGSTRTKCDTPKAKNFTPLTRLIIEAIDERWQSKSHQRNADRSVVPGGFAWLERMRRHPRAT